MCTNRPHTHPRIKGNILFDISFVWHQAYLVSKLYLHTLCAWNQTNEIVNEQSHESNKFACRKMRKFLDGNPLIMSNMRVRACVSFTNYLKAIHEDIFTFVHAPAPAAHRERALLMTIINKICTCACEFRCSPRSDIVGILNLVVALMRVRAWHNCWHFISY
jgi:hypothetical protein